MDSSFTAETWLFYGASDLYFSFHAEDWTFDHHSAFFAIMALEKHFKGFLLFHRAEEYRSLDEEAAKARIQAIAREYGHYFEKMAEACGKILGTAELPRLLDRDYDGYNGLALLRILQKAYMETRYPTDRRVFESFPVDEPGTFHDPLGSSGLHHFISEICQFLFLRLEPEIDGARVLRNLSKQYAHQEPFARFKNLYMAENRQTAGV